MSGMAGILNLDGRPVDPGLLDRMAEALRFRGPDGTKVWHDGPVGLVHCHFWTTPEDVGEEQPVCLADGRLWITADARLDNREELVRVLREEGHLYRSVPTDSEIILAAYQCWGQDCAQHLVGDLAFAVWDKGAKRLFLARDVIGIRQLYYAVVDETLYFANTIRAVLVALPRVPQLNRTLIHEFLHGLYRRWVCQTVHDGLLRLPPAHQMVVDRQVVAPRRYYVLAPACAPEPASEDEWLQRFRGVFEEAVRCRLRSSTPVGIAVSGGLDSSAVTCVAHDVTEGQECFPQVILYSSVYPETPRADESRFLADVAARCMRFRAKRIPSDGCWALREFGADGGFPLDEPELYALRSQSLAVLRAAAKDGCRVMLLGDGGDPVLGQNLYAQPHSMRGVGWRDWLAEIRYFRQWTGLGWWSLIFRGFLFPLIPERVRTRLEALRAAFIKTPPWLRGIRLDVCDQPSASRGVSPRRTKPSPSAQVVTANLLHPREIAVHSALDLTAAYAGIELRSPFFDRRVVELALQLPQRLMCWRGSDRIIVRQSLRGILPESVRLRRGKSDFGDLIDRGLHRERHRIERLLEAPVVENLGFLSAAPLRRAFEGYWHGLPADYRELLRPLYVEAWLRELAIRNSNAGGSSDG